MGLGFRGLFLRRFEKLGYLLLLLLDHLRDHVVAGVENLDSAVLGATFFGLVRGRGPELGVALHVNLIGR